MQTTPSGRRSDLNLRKNISRRPMRKGTSTRSGGFQRPRERLIPVHLVAVEAVTLKLFTTERPSVGTLDLQHGGQNKLSTRRAGTMISSPPDIESPGVRGAGQNPVADRRCTRGVEAVTPKLLHRRTKDAPNYLLKFKGDFDRSICT